MKDVQLVPGFKIGHAHDADLCSGVTVIVPDQPAIAAVHVMGGAPGTRETDLLSPEQLVQQVDAITLSGGSAFGLDAASGVQAWLREQKRGFKVGNSKIPIVPAAILYDLANGGNKDWGRYPPYRDMAYDAAKQISHNPETGKVGAGYGATTATGSGGLGIASEKLGGDLIVSSLVACNSVGSVFMGNTNHFWAAPFEKNNEFGGRGWPDPSSQARNQDFDQITTKGSNEPGANTTLAVVMTNAKLTQAECKRMAVNAHDGFARAIYPVHTPADGDIVFVLSSNAIDLAAVKPVQLYSAAANTVSRAIARGVYEASLLKD